MRIADGPEVTVEAAVAAPPATVWALVTDIDVPARFSPEFQGADWLDGATGPALGARFTGRNHHARMGGWSVTCTVVALEPGRCFGWDVGDPDEPLASWRFDLEPVDGGAATRLRQWARMGTGRSNMTPLIEAHPDREEQIVASRLEQWRAGMQATVDGIRDLAERPR